MKWFFPFAHNANNKNCAVPFVENAMKSIAFNAECRHAQKKGAPSVTTSHYSKIGTFSISVMYAE